MNYLMNYLTCTSWAHFYLYNADIQLYLTEVLGWLPKAGTPADFPGENQANAPSPVRRPTLDLLLPAVRLDHFLAVSALFSGFAEGAS